MRLLWRILVAALTGLLMGGPGWGATPGPVCRAACATRVAEGCRGHLYRQAGRCKRKVLRACRRSTPEIACVSAGATDGDLLDRVQTALANRRIMATSRRGPTTSTNDMTLCGSHDVHLHATTSSPAGDNDQTLDGTWTMELLGEATPVLSLNVGESTPRRFAVALDANGTPFFFGLGATIEDPGDACATDG
jgi:hypothetical protein